MVSAAGSNRRDLSLIPGRAEHQSVNSSEIVKFLLKTNDGRGRRPDWAIVSATMFQLKLGSARGVSQHTAYIWATVINTFLALCT